MREFTKAVTEKSVFENAYVKAIKFYILFGAGTVASFLRPEIAIPSTIVLSALDTFVLDRLGKKWNPGQFVDNTLRPPFKNN